MDGNKAVEGVENQKLFYRIAGCTVLLTVLLVVVSVFQYPTFPLPKFWIQQEIAITEEQQLEDYVRLNTATLEELQTLPGIGPVTAKAIVDYREAYGAFTKLDDLLEVKGIGPKVFEDLLPYIVL